MSAMRIWLEVVAMVVLSLIGLVIGGLTGWLPMSPILGTLFGLAGATWFLGREGVSWRDLGFARPMAIGRLLAYTVGTLALVFVVTTFVVTPLVSALGAPPLDVSLLEQAIEGNWVNYLMFLIPISWGSAAIGEELLARGFLLHRFSSLGGQHLAVFLQAAFFALAHFYQGPMGMANIFALAVVFGYVYYRCGRNLWPLILAHASTDTIGMTLLFVGRADLVVAAS